MSKTPFWSDAFHSYILNMWLELDLLMRYRTVWGFWIMFVDDRAPVATKRKTGTLMYCVLCLRLFNPWQLVGNKIVVLFIILTAWTLTMVLPCSVSGFFLFVSDLRSAWSNQTQNNYCDVLRALPMFIQPQALVWK